MIRGDEDLLSIMEAMTRGGNNSTAEAQEKPSKTVPTCERIRLMPEVEGYGNSHSPCPENGRSGNIWNPYVSVCFDDTSSSNIRGSPIMPPTCPYVEVMRRRAYEKFKKKYQAAFKWIVDNGQAKVNTNRKEKTGVDVSSVWTALPSHSILERFYFASKVEETFHVIENQKIKGLETLPRRADVDQIRRILSKGLEGGILMDPILISPLHRRKWSDTVLKDEVKFQFTREWKRFAKGKDIGDVDSLYSSKPFQKRCSKIVKATNDLCVEAESSMFQDLKKKASELILNRGRSTTKKSTPKLSFESKREKDSDDVTEYYSLTFSGLSFRIGKAHFEKLQRLFDRHNTNSQSIEEHQHYFLCDLFSLLARYDLLEGAGLQSSLSGNVFDVLLKYFQCNVECFASPFNCRYEHFCSAFPDTDSSFGSLGSFFNFNFEALPHGGCFQANPPFTSDFILKMCKRMEDLLTNTSVTAPFMFVVFIPAWQDSQGWKALFTSSVMVHHLFLSQKDDPHYYCEGTQYRRMKSRYRIASFDTSIFFLQNHSAKEKWPIHPNIIKELKEAFQTNPDEVLPMSPLQHAAKYTSQLDHNNLQANRRILSEPQPNHARKKNKAKSSNTSGNPSKRKSNIKSEKNHAKKSRIKKKFADDDQSQMQILSSLGIDKS